MGLFKKPKPQKSEAGNHAYGDISGAMKPALGYVTQGGDALANLLGVGTGDQTAALDKFANSGGMQWQMDQGNRMINSNQAAKGLLNSGSTLTGITKYGQGLGSTYMNDYMGKLLGLSNLGLGAGGLMANAGQYSKGTGATQGGMGKQMIPMLAQAGMAAAMGSDPRLKVNVELVGEREGLKLHEFEYRQDAEIVLPKGRFRGFMADEILKSDPDAVFEGLHGYLMVRDRKYFPKRIG